MTAKPKRDLCPTCKRPIGAWKPVKVCAACKKPMSRSHKWTFCDDGTIRHRNCKSPESYQ